jgi:hypothetical protein
LALTAGLYPLPFSLLVTWTTWAETQQQTGAAPVPAHKAAQPKFGLASSSNEPKTLTFLFSGLFSKDSHYYVFFSLILESRSSVCRYYQRRQTNTA